VGTTSYKPCPLFSAGIVLSDIKLRTLDYERKDCPKSLRGQCFRGGGMAAQGAAPPKPLKFYSPLPRGPVTHNNACAREIGTCGGSDQGEASRGSDRLA